MLGAFVVFESCAVFLLVRHGRPLSAVTQERLALSASCGTAVRCQLLPDGAAVRCRLLPDGAAVRCRLSPRSGCGFLHRVARPSAVGGYQGAAAAFCALCGTAARLPVPRTMKYNARGPCHEKT